MTAKFYAKQHRKHNNIQQKVAKELDAPGCDVKTLLVMCLATVLEPSQLLHLLLLRDRG